MKGWDRDFSPSEKSVVEAGGESEAPDKRGYPCGSDCERTGQECTHFAETTWDPAGLKRLGLWQAPSRPQPQRR